MSGVKRISNIEKKREFIPLEPNQNYSIDDGAKAAGVSSITIWRAIYAGHLETHRIGRRRILSGSQILTWIQAGGKTSRSEQSLAIAA